jgi:hypothetical protein
VLEAEEQSRARQRIADNEVVGMSRPLRRQAVSALDPQHTIPILLPSNIATVSNAAVSSCVSKPCPDAVGVSKVDVRVGSVD